MTDRLDLSPKHRAILEAIIVKHLPDVEVWAYGSRVKGESHDSSDLDLVLRGPGLNKIQFDVLGKFKVAVRESSIPILVEARDWARIPERFQSDSSARLNATTLCWLGVVSQPLKRIRIPPDRDLILSQRMNSALKCGQSVKVSTSAILWISPNHLFHQESIDISF